MEKRKEITNKMVEKHFEKGTKGLRILALLTVCVGIVELILGAAKGITASSANIFCTWYVAGGGILNALVGMWEERSVECFWDINHGERTYNEMWKNSYDFDFVTFSGNLKKWKKFLYTVVVKLQKIGYTKDTDFLGCSIALLF